MMHAKNRFRVLPLALTLAAFAACDGSNSTVGQVGPGGNLTLERVGFGRLVDIYSYQRIDPDPAKSDRRRRDNRRLTLVERDVVVDPGIRTQSVFDAAGNENDLANYEFLRFNKDVGHEQLVILWDNRSGEEQKRFEEALAKAKDGLEELPDSYRGQSTEVPLVPRNAAIRLQFSNEIDLTKDFLRANPSAIQLLEFKGDPNVVDPVDAFRILPYRAVVSGNAIILDTTVLGGEAAGGVTTAGLPQSSDQVTANIRVAIPSRGAVVSSFYVKADGVAQLNDIDSASRKSVIRDFRSGNFQDDPDGRLAEPEQPQIVGSVLMGITDVDPVANTITLNKRNNLLPVRGRYPFVDGGIKASGIPAGPRGVPTQRPLTTGDILVQDVTVLLENGGFEIVTLRAEILENLAINTVDNTANLGRAISSADGPQGELAPQVTIRLATVSPGVDSDGNPVSFFCEKDPTTGLPFPNGTDCTLRTFYVESLPFSNGNGAVSDSAWRSRFIRIEPSPAQPGVNVNPNASLSVEFTKPMDLDQVDPTGNLLVTNTPVAVETFAEQMGDPKVATSRIVPTRLTDLLGDGTVLRLQPPLGFAHLQNTAEAYSVHVRLGAAGVRDLGGNQVEVFDDLSNPLDSWSVDFTLAANAVSNRVGWKVFAFEDLDEDGTLPGSIDMFGQFRLQNGRLLAAEGVRFSRSANAQTLAPISRITRGECWDAAAGALVQPVTPPTGPGWVPAHPLTGAPHPGNLYWDPEVRDLTAPPPPPPPFGFDPTIQHPIGDVIEPLKPQGSRMQMRYIEDDFALSYREPSDFMLDIEQLYWSPFNDEDALFDEFDRMSMSLGHARNRGDELWTLNVNNECVMDCASMNSGLELTFAENILQGTSLTPVFEDRMYTVNPNLAVVDNTSQKFIPYPRFDRSYTWRDSRLVTVDGDGNVIGLGGAQNPDAVAPNNDRTANIDSPWIGSTPVQNFLDAGLSTYVQDRGDFLGASQRDHDPIALPLLVDIKVFPDDASNGTAQGANGFQMAMLGGTDGNGVPTASGYYDSGPSGCGALLPAWPRLRVHTSGGFDLISQDEVRIDPANVLVATGAVNKDVGLGAPATGLFQAPPGDGMLHYARADFVRRISTATFGFFDTLRPQLFHAVTNGQAEASPRLGFPDWGDTEGALRISDVVVQIDPPESRQPAGTSVVVQMRGADGFDNDGSDATTPQQLLPSIYNPTFELGATPNDRIAGDLLDVDDPDAGQDVLGRGNLLNPLYACEAYRYSTANLAGAARVAADGLTRYVTEDQVNLIRDPATGLLPRYMNLRLVMTNNIDVDPSLSPSLRSMSVTYRLAPSQN